VERGKVKRVVFDSLTSMALGVSSERRFKELVYAMGKHMRACGVTPLMTIEAQQMLGVDEVSGHGVSFVADNLIQLRYLEVAGRLERGLSVIKARGVKHDTSMHVVQIAKGGARVAAAAPRTNRGVLSGQARARRRGRR
jgi:circadian clock protein KaiC